MKTKPILSSEIASLKIASLPSRPTAPVTFGGRGYTAGQMKAAFDALPLYIIERLNALIAEFESEDFSSVLLDVPSGIREGHTIANLISDIKDGTFAQYFTVQDRTLAGALENFALRIGALERINHYSDEDFHLDGGTPALRYEEVSA